MGRSELKTSDKAEPKGIFRAELCTRIISADWKVDQGCNIELIRKCITQLGRKENDIGSCTGKCIVADPFLVNLIYFSVLISELQQGSEFSEKTFAEKQGSKEGITEFIPFHVAVVVFIPVH